METVLITGGSGMLGRLLARKLIWQGKYRVIPVASRRRSENNPGGGLFFEAADLLDEDAAGLLLERTNPDILCHLAWANGNANYRNSEENLRWLEASVRLMRGFRGRRFVYAGSSSQYGLSDGKGGRKRTLYGEGKRMFEEIAAQYLGEKGIAFASARIFTVYGPGDTKADAAIPAAIQALLRGERFRCEAPRNRWDFIYNDDAAGALAKLVDSNAVGALDIASGHPVRMREAFETIARAAGHPQSVEFSDGSLPEQSLTADVTRMENELGYTCCTSFEEGIDSTVRWWREKLGI